MPSKPASFVLVVGHGPQLEQEDGAAAQLRQLGAEVRTMDLWEDFGRIFDRASDLRDVPEEGAIARAVVFEGSDRSDLAIASLRGARRESRLTDVPAILSVPTRQVARVEPSSGFDDF